MASDRNDSTNCLVEILHRENSTLRRIIEDKNSIILSLKTEIEKYHECQKNFQNKLDEEFQQTKQENKVLLDALLSLEEKTLNHFLTEIRADTEALIAEKSRIIENLTNFKTEIESKLLSANGVDENRELNSNEIGKIVKYKINDFSAENGKSTKENEDLECKVRFLEGKSSADNENTNSLADNLNKIDDLRLGNLNLFEENENLKLKIESLQCKSAEEIEALNVKLNSLTAEIGSKSRSFEILQARFLSSMEEFKEFQMKFEYCKLNESRLISRLDMERNINEELREKLFKLEIQNDKSKEKITQLENDLNNAVVECSEAKNREIALQQSVRQLELTKDKALNEQWETECRRKSELKNCEDKAKILKEQLNKSIKVRINISKRFEEMREKFFQQRTDIKILHEELDKKEFELESINNHSRANGFFHPKRKRRKEF